MSNAYFNFQDFYRQIAALPDMNVLVEVGVYTGASVCFMAKELKKHKEDFDLYAIDIWYKAEETDYDDLRVDRSIWDAFYARMAEDKVEGLITPLCLTSVQAAKYFVDGSVDFVFIDADHSYEHVKEDIEIWLPKLRKAGGIIAGHDILEKSCGVEKAVVEKFGPNGYTVTNNCWWVRL